MVAVRDEVVDALPPPCSAWNPPPVAQRLVVQNFTVSSDGYGAGEGQGLDRPFGHADPRELMGWAMATASFPGPRSGEGTRGLDDRLVRGFGHRIGAEVMGRNKFGPQRGPWTDHEWQGSLLARKSMPTYFARLPRVRLVLRRTRHYGRASKARLVF